MRKILVMAMTVLCVFAACQEGTEFVGQGTKQELGEEKISYKVSMQEAVDELNAFLQEMDIETTRTRSGGAFTVDDIVCVTRNASNTRATYTEVDNNVISDTALYLINFGDETEENGYAVLSADSRAAGIVLAVTERGYITQENFLFETDLDFEGNDELLDFNFYNAVDDDYYVALTDGEGNNISHVLLQQCTDDNRLVEGAGGGGGSGSSSGPATTGWAYDLSVSPMLTTRWFQRRPFNEDCPIKKGNNAPVGCVAVALGQIMAYHEYPNDGFTIDGMTCNWDDIKTVCGKSNNYRMGYAHQHEQVAQFLAKVGSDCNMLYTSEFSFATPLAAKKCMEKSFYGYTNAKRNIGYNETTIVNSLNSGNPVFIAAISDIVNGHAWVIDGYKRQSRYVSGVHKTRYYMHCNWGWEGGACNGYYLSGVFDLSDGAVTSDAGTGDTSADLDFDWWFRTVTYDNPNK